MQAIESSIDILQNLITLLSRKAIIFSPNNVHEAITKIEESSDGRVVINKKGFYPSIVEETTAIEIVTSGKLIIIQMDITVLEKESYALYSLIPVPVFQKENLAAYIKSRAKYIAVLPGTDKHVLLDTLQFCKKQNAQTICRRNSPVKNKLDCEVELLIAPTHNTLHSCDVRYTNEKSIYIVKTSHPQKWVYSTSVPETARAICRNGFKTILLQHAGILTIPPGCRLQVKDDTLLGMGRSLTETGEFFIPLLQLVAVQANVEKLMRPAPAKGSLYTEETQETSERNAIIGFTITGLVGTVAGIIFMLWFHFVKVKTRTTPEESEYVEMKPIPPAIAWNFATEHTYATPHRHSSGRFKTTVSRETIEDSAVSTDTPQREGVREQVDKPAALPEKVRIGKGMRRSSSVQVIYANQGSIDLLKKESEKGKTLPSSLKIATRQKRKLDYYAQPRSPPVNTTYALARNILLN